MQLKNVYLPEEQIEKLLELAGEKSFAAMVRDAIDLYLMVKQNEMMKKVLAEAYKTFPEVDTDADALIRLGSHWYHNREANSKRGAIEQMREEQRDMYAYLKGKLGE